MNTLARTVPVASVLIVDDNDDIREILSSVLDARGYQVRAARGASEALAQLEHGPAPDVILLDLMMPDMTGWDFRVAQRRNPRLSVIPVVAMSAERSAQAQAIDADAYLSKPFEPQSMVDAIERVLVAAERKRLSVQSLEAERLRALGLLAAGVAHEINNPLAVVMGRAELSRMALRDFDPRAASAAKTITALSEHLEQIMRGAERIADVVRAIATLGRPDDHRIQDVDVNDAIRTSTQLLATEIHHRAKLSCELGDVPPVRGHASALVQVFINLLTNAVHAIPEGASESEVRVVTRLSPEGRVVVEISDTGSGIAPDLIGRIFEPFFTTKPISSGMGLGLAISHRLISELGGSLTVTSELGSGSTFRIELPAIVAAAACEPAVQQGSDVSSGRVRRVLVIDDDPAICHLLASLLKDTFEVTTQVSARDALTLLLQGTEFDAVLCDLMMPELTGMDVYAELMRHRPALADRIIFMTGGSFTDRTSAFLAEPGRRPLLKPFSEGEVVRRLDELDHPA